MRIDTCIVISFYDERPTEDLVRLLRRLRHDASQSEFAVRVVVNSTCGDPLVLPPDLSATAVDIRENSGFNIGAWHHGWSRNPGFRFYIFLQDECEIVNPAWLSRYKTWLSNESIGLVGESLLSWSNWSEFKQKWPEATRECTAIGRDNKIDLGRSPTHLQTLALGASALCLEATNGFVIADEKIKAIATEIMFSRHCLHRGFKIKQSAWRPFEYIKHPQWSALRDDSAKLMWNVSRALKQLGNS